MKLIKLVYIAHGWHLGLSNGQQLLDEVVYAWKYGPVIETLYHEFKRYEDGQITEVYAEPRPDGSLAYPLPDEKITPFLNTIWKVYGAKSGIELSSLTHQPNTPWAIVWNQRGGNQTKYAIIPNDLIEAHYREKIETVHARQAVIQSATTTAT